MEVHVENTGPCEARISFHVTEKEFEQEVKKALSRLGKGMKAKGFRPGKVPASMLEKTHGEAVRKDALQFFVQRAYEQAVKENDLKPVGFDRVNADELSREENGDFKHDLNVSLRPTFELGDYKGLPVDDLTKEVSDEEYDAVYADMKRQQSRPEPAGDEGLTEEGIALCKVIWTKDEETILEREGLRLSPLTPPPGVDADSFKEGMVGGKDGEAFDLDLVIPAEFEKPELAGQQGLCTVEISQAFKMIEPTDEEVCKILGVETMDDVKPELLERIGEAKVREEKARQEEFLIDHLLAAHPMDLPEPMVKSQVEARLAQLANQMREDGIPDEEVEKHLEGEREGAETASRRGMQALFLIQAIAEKEELLVNNDEMLAEIQSIADRNQASVDEVKKYYQENRLMDQMALEILERKVRAFLRDHANVQTSASS